VDEQPGVVVGEILGLRDDGVHRDPGSRGRNDGEPARRGPPDGADRSQHSSARRVGSGVAGHVRANTLHTDRAAPGRLKPKEVVPPGLYRTVRPAGTATERESF
jgi:hypothetical protein